MTISTSSVLVDDFMHRWQLQLFRWTLKSNFQFCFINLFMKHWIFSKSRNCKKLGYLGFFLNWYWEFFYKLSKIISTMCYFEWWLYLLKNFTIFTESFKCIQLIIFIAFLIQYYVVSFKDCLNYCTFRVDSDWLIQISNFLSEFYSDIPG